MHRIVSISGGKDSTTAALTAISVHEKDDKIDFCFCDTGNEHPITYDYIRYLSGEFKRLVGQEITWLKADFSREIDLRRNSQVVLDGIENQKSFKYHLKPSHIPMLDLAMLRGFFFTPTQRACTVKLKVEPIKQFITQVMKGETYCENWTGVRADESRARANLPHMELFMKDYKTGNECWTVRPCLHLTAEQCFAELKRFNIEPNPLYKMGFSRVGCMPCMMINRHDLAEISERFPAELYRIEAWEKIVTECSKLKKVTFFYDEHGKKGVWEKVKWATGNEKDTALLDDFDPVCCKSIYGLCE